MNNFAVWKAHNYKITDNYLNLDFIFLAANWMLPDLNGALFVSNGKAKAQKNGIGGHM